MKRWLNWTCFEKWSEFKFSMFSRHWMEVNIIIQWRKMSTQWNNEWMQWFNQWYCEKRKKEKESWKWIFAEWVMRVCCHYRKPFCPWALNRYLFNLMNIATTVQMVRLHAPTIYLHIHCMQAHNKTRMNRMKESTNESPRSGWKLSKRSHRTQRWAYLWCNFIHRLIYERT